MKKGLTIFIVLLVILILVFLGMHFLKDSPQLSDNAKVAWLEKCGDNANCKNGVEKYYLNCVNSLSFEKPKSGEDISEYMSLTKMELESCFSENIGKDFPIE